MGRATFQRDRVREREAAGGWSVDGAVCLRCALTGHLTVSPSPVASENHGPAPPLSRAVPGPRAPGSNPRGWGHERTLTIHAIRTTDAPREIGSRCGNRAGVLRTIGEEEALASNRKVVRRRFDADDAFAEIELGG